MLHDSHRSPRCPPVPHTLRGHRPSSDGRLAPIPNGLPGLAAFHAPVGNATSPSRPSTLSQSSGDSTDPSLDPRAAAGPVTSESVLSRGGPGLDPRAAAGTGCRCVCTSVSGSG